MRSLTGIQPTNFLHIGNYFGALLPAVELAQSSDLTMMIVDLHAITVPYDVTTLRSHMLFLAAAYMAAGIDPKKTTLFQQSQVAAHSELAWILQTICRMGEAERMTQFKDKAGAQAQKVSVGLFTYPVLMAADILLYDTEIVPVGEDQKQHVELARDLAIRFNRDFGETFVVPKPQIRAAGARIKSLVDPSKKMSKSAASAKSYISLMDDADTIAKKIRGAVTDSETGISVDDNRPGLKNLLTILHLVTKQSLHSLVANYENKGMSDLKNDVAEALVTYLKPLQTKIRTLLENEDALIEVINDGSARAKTKADAKMAQVKDRMGMLLRVESYPA